MLKKIGNKYFFDFHDKLRKNEIILEGIAGEKILEIFKKLSKKELESHLNRLLVSYLIPDEYIDFGMDIISFKKVVYLIDINEAKTIVIKNEIIAKIFKNLIQFMGERARKIDINQYIKELLNKVNLQ